VNEECTTIAPAPPPPEPPTFVDFPPAPPPPITNARTVDTAAGTVQVVAPVRVNESTQSPFDATVIVTPVASPTSAEHEPFDTATACAGDTITVDGSTKTEAVKAATIPMTRLHVRIDLFNFAPI
jgi:hypothetical protein